MSQLTELNLLDRLAPYRVTASNRAFCSPFRHQLSTAEIGLPMASDSLFDNPWSRPVETHDFRHGKELDDTPSSDDDDEASTVDAAERQAAGNQLFKDGDLEGACEAYASALSSLVGVPEPDLSAMSAVLCNRSAALVKLGRSEDAVQDATDAIKFDRRQAKPHYRLATALKSLGRHREVVDACDEGLELAPEHEQLEALRTSAFAQMRCMADFGRGMGIGQ